MIDGHVFPGPCLPFGVVKVGFDAEGEPKYGVISQFPVVDLPDKKIRIYDYSSTRSFEHFEVGYSKFGLKRYNIMVELTASRRVGLHRYTFPPSENNAKVILDLSHILSFGRYRGGWNSNGPYKVYFCSQFNVNATEQATWWNNRIDINTTFCVGTNGDKIGAILTFDTIKNPVIISRVGISFISADQACNNAESEIPDWDFDVVKQNAVDAWDNELGKIRVESDDENLKKIFYSDIARSLIDIYEKVGYMPDGRSGSSNGITQGGSNADMAETYLKQIDVNDKIDWNIAYEALLKDAEVDPWEEGLFQGRLHLTDYKKYGYIPSPYDRNLGYIDTPCSRTLEYSANDYSISLVAKGILNDYIKYKNRATSWENLWHPNVTYDEWAYGDNLVEDFYSFYESTSWDYSLDVPFDRLDKTFADKSFSGGYYNIGNEPSFFHTCLYHFIGKQYKSVDVIRTIMKTKFGVEQDGIPAYNLTDNNIYIQNVKINNKEWEKTWFRHKDISGGAIMEIQMGSEPSKIWSVISEDEDNKVIEDRVVPPSMSDYMDK
ncbi:13591_t:CDS:2 [Racocetra fulgida]|uniref:13591_t:CDS:1 n=1 Tax=Racocetra fulgida TaxID=60492 RepID=A0A9N9F0B4_9GLOM|nr:13591_t:CDS:2 [Racocetra fulgida]